MHVLGCIADITGLLSFLLSIILLVRSESLRKEIDSQKSEYSRDQKSIKTAMMALRLNVWEDQLLNLRIVSEIRTQLYAFRQKFGRLLTREDKKQLQLTFVLLDDTCDAIDREKLCKKLDYFIARFERQELK